MKPMLVLPSLIVQICFNYRAVIEPSDTVARRIESLSYKTVRRSLSICPKYVQAIVFTWVIY